jgi:Prokaryotic glutathione synthetase, ATP-grasp domain
MKVGFVTCEELPLITNDDQLVADELKKLGIEVMPIIWERDIELESFNLIVIRSCWNYHLKLQEFIKWLDKIDDKKIKLFNPSNIVRWNLNKKYLAELANQGVIVPKTIWVKQGDTSNLASILKSNEIEEAVIKPTVSLSAYNTWRTSTNTALQDQDKFAKQVEIEELMIQLFVREIMTEGELSFVFLDGQYSHAVRKRAKEGDFRVQSDFGGTKIEINPSDKQVEQIMKVYSLIKEPLMYARIDVVEVQGQMSLMEVELIDPELYFRFNAKSAKRMAETIARHC